MTRSIWMVAREEYDGHMELNVITYPEHRLSQKERLSLAWQIYKKLVLEEDDTE